jgi:hypothetical protein
VGFFADDEAGRRFEREDGGAQLVGSAVN